MTDITLAVPKTVAQRMRRHPEIRWSRIAREAIVERLRLLDALEKATDPTLGEKEATQLALEIHHSKRRNRDRFHERQKRILRTGKFVPLKDV